MTKSLPYLGIKVVSPTSSTYEANFTTLLETIKNNLSHIAFYELSWLSRMASQKMLLLPKRISFLENIYGREICLKLHYIKLHYTTQRHRYTLGTGFPIILYYYRAAILGPDEGMVRTRIYQTLGKNPS